MKKLISELKLNPINPRTITKENMERLILSILLFPKMLTIRDIIINKDDMVLSGNKRTEGLTAIAAMTDEQLEEMLQKSPRYQKLDPKAEQPLVKLYWQKWRENPEVDVTVADNITEEEEKELLIKDNKEYGYFDMEAMKGIYDADTLAEFGLEVDTPTYDPTEDDPDRQAPTEGEGERQDGPIFAEILRFGRNRVPVTEAEYAALEMMWNEYVESTGQYDGFITYILDRKEKKD